MIVAPPLFEGAVNVTVACAFPALAVPIVGAPGTVGAVVLRLRIVLQGPILDVFLPRTRT